MGSSKKADIGFKYYMSAHVVVCQGPVDNLSKITYGDRDAWEGNSTSNEEIYINKPNLFGGDKKQGGIQGYVDLLFGETDQTANAHLQSILNRQIIPGFRGVMSAVFKGVFFASNNPYFKPMRFKVKRIPKGWYESRAEVDGQANPAHIIYEVLTNRVWGAAISSTDIDEASFTQAADTLFDENFGLAIKWDKAVDRYSFIKMIIDHIGAAFYLDVKSGLFVLKLLRDDYVVAELPNINADSEVVLERISFERRSNSDTVNKINITYKDRETNKKETVSVSNLASINIIGKINPISIDYLGLPNFRLASRIAARELKTRSAGIAKLEIVINRTGWNYNVGDVFSYTDEELELQSVPFRIVSLNKGNFQNREIRIIAIEDVFGLPEAEYVNEGFNLFIDPVVEPVNLTYKRIIDVPYYFANREYDTALPSALNPTFSHVGVVAVRPATYYQDYEFHTGTSAAVINAGVADEQITEGYFVPSAELTTNIDRSDDVTIIYQNDFDFNQVSIGDAVLLNDEILEVTTVTLATNTLVLKRGILDTIPSSHLAGDRLYVIEEFLTIEEETKDINENIFGKVLPITSLGILPVADADDDNLIMQGRIGKPYPPANVRFNSLYYPSNIAGTMTINWSHRNQDQQSDVYIDWYESDVTVEEYSLGDAVDDDRNEFSLTYDVCYDLDIFDNTTDGLIAREKGIVRNRFIYPDDCAYYSAVTQSATGNGFDPYLNSIVYKVACSSGLDANNINSGGVYINDPYVHNDDYSADGYSQHSSFDAYKDSGLYTNNFVYLPSGSSNVTASGSSSEIPINLLDNSMTLNYVAFNHTIETANCDYTIQFRNQLNEIVFVIRAIGNNTSTVRNGWTIEIIPKNIAAFKYTRTINYASSFAITLSRPSDNVLRISSSKFSPLDVNLPIETVRNLRIDNCSVNIFNASTTRNAHFEITHSLTNPISTIENPLTLNGRTVRVEINSDRLGNDSYQKFEHTLMVDT